VIGVSLAWAVLLWFHPDVDPNDVYGTLRDEATEYVIVHVGTLVFNWADGPGRLPAGPRYAGKSGRD